MLAGANPGGWILNPSIPVTSDGAGGVTGAPGVTAGATASG